ncbi:MAG TPA: biopolymer transporter ExbD [Kiritimatiellia bacterium]|nr:biopolymer transporter ExbD [Kiritimatiellia bacterium]HMO98632.1 biopolymer transporter ExbD [Kiritimatiellia bacterium]HMP96340.1 biopolymer transporter ExbD [Kiritimatiellia bacterium]
MKKPREEGGVNMTPMIDVVFQLIIFFVCTVELERQAIDESIRLSMAPHGPAVEVKDPREVVIEVDDRGRISIARNYMSDTVLRNLLRNVVANHGQTTPVIIRAAGGTRHEDVRKVMDAAAYAGLWKVSFAAIKEVAQ